MIPDIIHQTYKTDNIPKECIPFQVGMRALHSDWTFNFYDDVQCKSIIDREYPELSFLYENVPYSIMRADIFRIVIVFLQGGYYFDIDVKFHKSLTSLNNTNMVLSTEKILSNEDCIKKGHRDNVRIGNYGFGSIEGNPFFQFLIHAWIENTDQLINIKSEHDLLEATGPGFFTSNFNTYYKNDLTAVTLLPLGNKLCERCLIHSCQFGDFASHLHMGSWRWE